MDELEKDPDMQKEILHQIALDFKDAKSIVLAGRLSSVYTRHGHKLPSPINDTDAGMCVSAHI